MKRSAPMKRAGFKPKAPPPRPFKTIDYTPRARAPAVAISDGKAKMSAAHSAPRGPMSEVQRAALSAAHSGKPWSDARRAAQPNLAGIPWSDARRLAQKIVSRPKEPKANPGKYKPNLEERAWLDFIVSYGCIACRLDGHGVVPPAVHHMLRGGRRIGHLFSLPLCQPGHHMDGQSRGMVSRHPWKARFEAKYGTEAELLQTLQAKRMCQ